MSELVRRDTQYCPSTSVLDLQIEQTRDQRCIYLLTCDYKAAFLQTFDLQFEIQIPFQSSWLQTQGRYS